jgi:hypothetical protein
MKKTIAIILFFLVALVFAGAGGYYFWKNRNHQKITVSSEEVANKNSSELAKEKNLEEANVTVESNPEKTTPASNKSKSQLENKVVERKKPSIINKNVSWGFQVASGRKIDAVIVHSSYNALGGDKYDVDKLIEEYKQYQVSPHYLIDRKGQAYRLVSDKNIAYHAGEGKTPDGRENVNDFSIGIELMNDENDQYTEEQYNSLLSLVDALIIQYHPKYILGHSQIAPDRKTDPWNFDWDKFNAMMKEVS